MPEVDSIRWVANRIRSVLELMTEGRTRLDQRLAAPGPCPACQR
ncbi:MAG TPA: hypothetical protein VG388_02675 [Solirubrobacteraceae bacterium]|nr:hypothetical protein [Solirubrobacteraceae bacterium]